MHTTAKAASTVLATAAAGLLALGAMGAAAGADATATAKPEPAATQGTTKVLKDRQTLPGMKSLKGQSASKRIVLKGYTYDSVWHDNMSWSANVRIHSGQYGAYTKCSDGSTRYGPKQGPGYWRFGGNCEGAGHLTGFGVYGEG
ncbi:hypothetical protein E1287_17600 [Actinomadura sp. KC06]|uniref:hypothetical protein n=1 Tax=Actinomadura sp. KC06 TaxID=2530369 RepID=UPI00104E89F9|nr:hypothetical protein [Actinomadura sp. KC06]TDD34160.1 hypothetical protein E1287_17600 [Actinomadura sp. KC06]